MSGDSYQPMYKQSNVEKDPNIKFDVAVSLGDENNYLTMVKNQIFDKSRYQNLIFKQEGRVPPGYDFYAKRTKPDGKGVTVVANTAMVAELFWIRGVEIDILVENDEEEINPDNVRLEK